MLLRRLAILYAMGCLAGCQMAPARPSAEPLNAERPLPERGASRTESASLAESSVQPAAYIQPAQENLAPPVHAASPPIPAEMVLPPAPQVELSPELALADLEQMAMSNNPTLAEAWSAVEAAAGRRVQGGLFPNTIVGYSGQQLGSRGEAEQQGLYVEQDFVRARKLDWNMAVAAGEMQVARQRFQTQRQRVLTDVRLGYYEVLVAQRRLELSQRLAEIAQASVRTAEALLRAMEVSRADVLRATIELQTAELALRTSANAYDAAWTRLTAVLGAPGMPSRPLAGDLREADCEMSLENSLARLLSESPELAAARADVDRARAQVERALVEPLPDVNVQGIIQHDNATDGSNGNLQVSLPIPYLNRNQGGIREARANLIAAQQAVGRVELDLQRRLAGVYQRYANAKNQVDAYARPGGILENAQSTLDLVRTAYEAGQLSYVDLLTAQRTNAQTNLAYVEALGELWSAISELEGLLLRDSLSADLASLR